MLLEIEGAVDKTGYNFRELAEKIEADIDIPDLIIRNGTFFRWINKNCKTISLIQDRYVNDETQRECIIRSDHIVFNSEFTRDAYLKDYPKPRSHSVIHLGVNESVFYPQYDLFENKKKTGIFVGDFNSTKNTSVFREICNRRKDLSFIYVSKSGNTINYPNVANIRGGASETQMADLYNSADFCVMCSPVETLHLSSIEAALCDKPIVGSNTGWLTSHYDPRAGIRIDDCNDVEAYCDAISDVIAKEFSPREYILENTPFTWRGCKSKWEQLIKDVLNTK